jgi:hypothetical protein
MRSSAGLRRGRDRTRCTWIATGYNAIRYRTTATGESARVSVLTRESFDTCHVTTDASKPPEGRALSGEPSEHTERPERMRRR